MTIALGNEYFLYIDREESILCFDQIKQNYLMVDETELYHCKTKTT